MSIGTSVDPEFFDDVCHFCENENINYQVWNAADILLIPGTFAEMDFDTPEDFKKVIKFIRQLVINSVA